MTAITSSCHWRIRAVVWIAAIAVVALAADAWGQASSGAQFRRGTTLAGFAGAASASGTNKLSLGTALGWEVHPHLTLEGRGLWLPDDPGSTDFMAWFGAIVPAWHARTFVPFASAGVGMYRATVEPGAVDVPEFYQRRMGTRQRAIFEDVAFAFGGGANVFISSHFALRPQVDLVLVTTRADTRPMAIYGVQLAYHFEPHKIQ